LVKLEGCGYLLYGMFYREVHAGILRQGRDTLYNLAVPVLTLTICTDGTLDQYSKPPHNPSLLSQNLSFIALKPLNEIPITHHTLRACRTDKTTQMEQGQRRPPTQAGPGCMKYNFTLNPALPCEKYQSRATRMGSAGRGPHRPTKWNGAAVLGG
jgi:hypothetical protein